MAVRKQAVSVVPHESEVSFRKPRLEDGAAVWALIRDTKVLDLNSSYCYLMLSTYFRNTCIVAERDGSMVGFVSGFIPSDRSDTLFIWQVAVDEQVRGLGIGSGMLERLLERDCCNAVHYLETTVSPSNEASEAMFQRVAHNLGTTLHTVGSFPVEVFPEGNHESERVFRIGPFVSRSH